MLEIEKINDVFIRIKSEADIAYEISEYFTFSVPGARFSPAFRNRLWDGKIRLFHLGKRTLYHGLLDAVTKFAQQRNYNILFTNPDDFKHHFIDNNEIDAFVRRQNLPHEVRDYQKAAFIHAIKNKRTLLLSPTGSGKSLIIYMLARYNPEGKVLIVVPTTGLIHQMASDFISYGCNPSQIHKIYSGQQKINDEAGFHITTWQSVYKQPLNWFKPYKMIVGDEAHTFKAKSLIELMEKTVSCPFKIGLTGTLDGTHTNKMVLEGLFGSVYETTTTKQLINQSTLAKLRIKAIVLDYDQSKRQSASKQKLSYQDEVQYLINHSERNRFIAGLVKQLSDNTLLLFNIIKHGQLLYDTIKQAAPQKEVFLVYGAVEGVEREKIRMYAEDNDNIIIVASYKTFSTGVNIKNIHNIIFGSPSKSRIRIFQSIGRGLRMKEHKTEAIVYDIADDLSWKSYKNHTVQHFEERIRMYNQEQFEYKIFNVSIKENT